MSKNNSNVSEYFFGPNLQKNGFKARTFKNLTPDWNQLFQDTMCNDVLAKRTILNF